MRPKQGATASFRDGCGPHPHRPRRLIRRGVWLIRPGSAAHGGRCGCIDADDLTDAEPCLLSGVSSAPRGAHIVRPRLNRSTIYRTDPLRSAGETSIMPRPPSVASTLRTMIAPSDNSVPTMSALTAAVTYLLDTHIAGTPLTCIPKAASLSRWAIWRHVGGGFLFGGWRADVGVYKKVDLRSL
jgi:hypothetical protein